MKIFVSWSGDRSHAVAKVLGPWMKRMVQSVEYWLSSEMERGVKWLAEIDKSLDEHSFGVLCVTPENIKSVWLNFEAGALSKHLGTTGRVIPYALGFKRLTDLGTPLGGFNGSLADEEGTWQLIETINNHAEYKLDKQELQLAFNTWWPDLKGQLDRIAAIEVNHDHQPVTFTRPPDEKIDEILAEVRALSRSAVTNEALAQLLSDMQLGLTHEHGINVKQARLAEAASRAAVRERLKQADDETDLPPEYVRGILQRHISDDERIGLRVRFPGGHVIAVSKILDSNTIARIENDVQMLTRVRPNIVFDPVLAIDASDFESKN